MLDMINLVALAKATAKADKNNPVAYSFQGSNYSYAQLDDTLRKEMNELASTLPEYETVMSMYGVGETYGPQLIAEIGDVSRFTHGEAITAFAGVDPGVNESGQFKQRSNRASKNGSTRLRKTLFQVMSTYLQNKPVNEPVYQFLDRKRAEGKPYLVYMTAGANKFLRIYYGKVKECLRNLEQSQIEES